jgi:hypothetical protein
MLVKLTPRVDFTNILVADFMHENPNSAKRTDDPTFILKFLKSAFCKMLVKLTPVIIVAGDLR